ncbi:MAG TPA: hypothetical protein VFJ58_15955 [Armatimonadota bacterium]|nr:hypothetical protein [Armatimonadota bacterium]
MNGTAVAMPAAEGAIGRAGAGVAQDAGHNRGIAAAGTAGDGKTDRAQGGSSRGKLGMAPRSYGDRDKGGMAPITVVHIRHRRRRSPFETSRCGDWFPCLEPSSVVSCGMYGFGGTVRRKW